MPMPGTRVAEEFLQLKSRDRWTACGFPRRQTPQKKVRCMTDNNYILDYDPIVSFWISYCADPEQSTLNALAAAIERECRQRMRDGCLNGLLHGHEDEIRQSACLLLLHRFLAGNQKLNESVGECNRTNLSIELSKSIFAALRYSKLQLARRLAVEASRRVELDECHQGITLHSSQRSFFALPEDIRRQLALATVQIAVEQRKFTEANASIAREIIDGESVSDIAERLQISRSAVYQRLKQVKASLPGILKKMEYPL